MSELITHNGMLFSVFASLAALLYLTRIKNNELKQRTRELDVTRQALMEHYKYVTLILKDPAPSLELKRVMTLMSCAISTRTAATDIARQFKSGKLKMTPHDEATDGLVEELRQLKISRPDLAEKFEKAVSTGITALFLRWPENSKMLNQLRLEMDKNQSSKVSFTSNIAKFLGNGDNDNHGLGGGNLIGQC